MLFGTSAAIVAISENELKVSAPVESLGSSKGTSPGLSRDFGCSLGSLLICCYRSLPF